MEQENTRVIRLSDFRVAGFLSARGISLTSAEMNGSNEVVFVFDDEDGAATKLLCEYPRSEEQQYDSACKAMMEIVKITQRNKPKAR